jgi:hypothetical protein
MSSRASVKKFVQPHPTHATRAKIQKFVKPYEGREIRILSHLGLVVAIYVIRYSDDLGYHARIVRTMNQTSLALRRIRIGAPAQFYFDDELDSIMVMVPGDCGYEIDLCDETDNIKLQVAAAHIACHYYQIQGYPEAEVEKAREYLLALADQAPDEEVEEVEDNKVWRPQCNE